MSDAQATIGLWRYGPVTGYWKLERTCERHSAQLWLVEYQKDEPEAVFKLSVRKPRTPPPNADS